MSSDSFTETTSTSFGSRFRSIISGVFIAPLALLGGCYLLWWNEGNTVQTARSLDEGQKQVISIPADKIDPANIGKLVYVTGETTVREELRDADFGISSPAIKLKRVVEMYQWAEETKTSSKKNKSTTTYNYDRKWLERALSSSNYHRSGHDNPGHMPWQSGPDELNETATLGAFQFNTLQLAQLNNGTNEHPREITADEFAALPQKIRDEGQLQNGEIYFPVNQWLPHAERNRLNKDFTPAAGTSSPTSPQIGDIRLKYVMIKTGPATIVAQQTATGFDPFKTKAGKPVHLLELQKLTVEQMFDAARAENTMWAWMLRGAGLLAIFVGFMLAMAPLSALAEWVPLLGSLVSGGIFLVSLAGTLVVGSAVISVAWLVFHPFLALGIILVGVLPATLLWFLFARKKQPNLHPSGLEVMN